MLIYMETFLLCWVPNRLTIKGVQISAPGRWRSHQASFLSCRWLQVGSHVCSWKVSVITLCYMSRELRLKLWEPPPHHLGSGQEGRDAALPKQIGLHSSTNTNTHINNGTDCARSTLWHSPPQPSGEYARMLKVQEIWHSTVSDVTLNRAITTLQCCHCFAMRSRTMAGLGTGWLIWEREREASEVRQHSLESNQPATQS